MADRKIVAFPHLRIAPSSIKWSAWTLMNPPETDLQEVSQIWDYAVDLRLGIEVECSAASVIRAVGRSHAHSVGLAAEAVCRETAWRSVVTTPLVPLREGTLGAAVNVDVPGSVIDGRVSLTAHLVGPGRRPGLDRRAPGARLAEGPVEHIDLSAPPDRLPITPVSFSAQGWSTAPWRFVVDAHDLQAPYNRCARLYLNSDLQAAQELMQRGEISARRRALASVRKDVVMGLLLNLTLGSETSTDLDAAATCDDGALGSVAEQLCRHHFGQGLRITAHRLFHDPEGVIADLEESVGYYGEVRE